ncbi:MAG: DNA alkylation repair protein [Phycisphaeraceae bacterium]|nr:DNA alkylation repair protein [Phycisphaeraceae bacterium]
MDLATALKELERRGDAGIRKDLARHGVKGKTFGLSAANLNALAKKIGKDHALALELWKTGNHDARVLATRIADPVQINAATVDRWAREADNHVITEAVAEIAAKAAAIGAGVKVADAKRWSDSPDEWISTLGWNMLGLISDMGKLAERDAMAALDRIERGIQTAKNRTRHAMNHALIRIGNGLGALRERALVAAEKIGKVEVDHGKTGGATPDAADAIRKGKTGAAGKAAGKPATKAGAAARKEATKAGASNGKGSTAKAAKPAARRKTAAAR